MNRPGIYSGQFKYLVESILLVMLIGSFAYVYDSGLYRAIALISDQFAHSKVTITFSIATLNAKTSMPLVVEAFPENIDFESVSCDRADQLTRNENKIFNNSLDKDKTFMRCVFRNKPQLLGNKKHITEREYIEKYLLRNLDANWRYAELPLEFAYAQNSFFPYTEIPIRPVENWAKIFIEIAIVIFL
jgi:hypothetical protein